jgi:transcriptional regulator with XRE-family HTH domain
MSPASFAKRLSDAVRSAERRLWLAFGLQIREARLARHWSVRILADRAGVSRSLVYLVENGEASSTEAALRLASALGMRLEFALSDARQRSPVRELGADIVHSAMGELEAAHLRGFGYNLGIDEPYQHYQFAGRADLAAWDLDRRALLHLENRTRFPDLQGAAGAFNAKRAYLGAALAARLGVTAWASETHVVVAAWTSEVLHSLRIREASFRALCPDGGEAFAGWWEGQPPTTRTRSCLVVLDPLAAGRQRRFVDLDAALIARPRHRGYAELAARLGARA